MAIQNKNILYSWFLRGKKPLERQFHDWMDSYWHKTDDKIRISDVDSLANTLAGKAEASLLGELATSVAAKQDKTDAGLETSDKTIVGGINEVLVKLSGIGSNNEYLLSVQDIFTINSDSWNIKYRGSDYYAVNATSSYLELSFPSGSPALVLSNSSTELRTYTGGNMLEGAGDITLLRYQNGTKAVEAKSNDYLSLYAPNGNWAMNVLPEATALYGGGYTFVSSSSYDNTTTMLAGGMSRMLLSPTETSLKHFNGINIVTANSTHTKIYNPSGKEMMSGNIYASSDTPSVYLKNAAVNQYAITSSMHGTRLYGTNGIPLIQAGDYRIFIRKPGSTETNQNVFESMAIRLGKDVFEMRNPASDLVFFNASGGGITLYGLSGKKMLESIGNSNSLCYPLTGSVALSIGGVNGDSIEMNKIGSGSKFFYANSFEYGFTDAYGGLHGYDGDGIVLRPGYPNMYTKIPVGFVISNAPNPQSLDFFMTDYNAGGRLYRSSIDSAKNMLGIPASGAASLSDFSDHVAVDSSRWQSILDDRTKQWEAIEGLQNKTTSGSTPEDMLTTSETDAGYIVANALGGVVTYKTKAVLGLLLGSGTLTINGVQEDKGLTLIGGVSGTKVVKDGDKVQSVNMESLTFTPYIAA